MIGHNNSKATGGSQTVCRTETRYTEERKTVYSHSTVTFMHDGRDGFKTKEVVTEYFQK